MARCKRGEEGFTLLEVMVSLAIIALTFPLMLSLINRQVGVHLWSERTTIGILLAQEKMVETELGGPPAIGYTEGDFGERYPSFRWKREVRSTLVEKVREVFVRVMWGTAAHPEDVTLTTYVVSP
jgi:type II secretion system protein I